ncbi:hypothetical protein [Proteus terrae]|uniref:hypothetical protein n=2 Tax=Proteus TaxID=583 RepID=UPI0013A5962F|nr:hypothetical protein [Proteus terrae]
MDKLRERIIEVLQCNQLTTDELYHLCSPDYSRSQVSCVIGHLEAGGIIKKNTCEYWELINETSSSNDDVGIN